MKLLVLDGNSILNRAFYGIKVLSTKDGFYTNAIYGFLNILIKLQSEAAPDAVAIAFDMKAPTFRHKKYSAYKAKRKGMPEELYKQFPVLKELLGYLGYAIVEKEGFEADDILGTLAQACTDRGETCVIATGDKDSLQLVSKDVSVRITSTKFGKAEVTLYDEAKIFETFGLTPAQLIDLKAIQGDTSDNIPGVPGIGQKGALELMQKFGSLDYIYQNIENLDIKPGTKNKLLLGKESAYLSKELGTIIKNVPIDTELEHYIKKDGSPAEASRLLSKLEMFSMIQKLGLPSAAEDIGDSIEEVVGKFKVSVNPDLTNVYGEILQQDCTVFHADLDLKAAEFLNFSIVLKDCIYVIAPQQAGFLAFVKKFLEDKEIKKISYNAKSLYFLCESLKIGIKSIDFDITLAAYLLNSSSKDYELSRLATEYSVKDVLIDGLDEKSELFDLAKKTSTIYALYDIFSEKIAQQNLESLLKNIEIPFAQVLSAMEYAGVCIDRTSLEKFSEKLTLETNKLEAKVKNHLGSNININSPKQLGVALFEDLGLPAKKKTKSGYSTSAEILESLRYTHPVIDSLLQYRTLSKLKSTYCDGLLGAIAKDGKIHSTFNQTETKTGRISSTEPNLQNIPVRTELGKEFRKFFVAKDGCLLVDADYSQIELRLLAHLADDSNMISAFKENLDIHQITASEVFGLPCDLINSTLRNRAKAVNFGIIYGIGAFSLAKDIGVSIKEADTYIKNYFSHYASVKNYMQKAIEAAKTCGFAQTMFGRRRYLPELKSSNFNLRAFGERVARNMPIQGSAADIIKIAMINVQKALQKEALNAKIILQVHDEIIVECAENQVDRVKEILEDNMQNAVSLRVPLIAEAHAGKTWYDAKD
ncbi:MAG: DNA polymerase I [Clostridia bacterium]|nr:DNA polymerase I [Clostridia bacterium]